jgi:hypothetical protein
MTSFADSWEHQEFLKISKQHLDALDATRVRPDAVIGVDNWNNLKVASVFAAIAVEAALNDYILAHCLSLRKPYLQDVFGDITKRFLRGSVDAKVEFLREHWPDEIPSPLVKDVKRLFVIRNRIVHRTGEYPARHESDDGNAVMKNSSLSNEEMQHMRRHYDIARDFLSRFWFPGARELDQPPRS